MAKQATIAGTKFYFEHELITVAVNTPPPKNKSVTATPQSVELLFANGVVVRAARVLLNLPVQPMQVCVCVCVCARVRISLSM